MKLKGIEQRDYQIAAAEEFSRNYSKNYVLYAPAGTGKTEIAFLTIAKEIEDGKIDEGEKVLVVVPSRPLATQWYERFNETGFSSNYFIFLNRPNKDFYYSKRYGKELKKKFFKSAKIIISTPKLLESDLISKTLDKRIREKIKLVVLDEVHNFLAAEWREETGYRINKDYRAVADYIIFSYYPQVLGLTATLNALQALTLEKLLDAKIVGFEENKIKKYIPEVSVYDIPIESEWVRKIDAEIHCELVRYINAFLNYVKEVRREKKLKISSVGLLNLIVEYSAQDKYEHIRNTARRCLKLIHAKNVLHGGEIDYFYSCVSRNAQDESSGFWESLKNLTEDYIKSEGKVKMMPKTKWIVKNVKEALKNNERVIIYSRFINHARRLKEILEYVNVDSLVLSGTLSQDAQKNVIQLFKEEYPVLISTGVGEEGLDFPYSHRLIHSSIYESPRKMEQRSSRIRGGKVYRPYYAGTSEEFKLKKLNEGIESFKDILHKIESNQEEFKRILGEWSKLL